MGTTALSPRGVPRRVPRRYRSGELPGPTGPRLRAALASAHAQEPFTPRDVRSAVARVRSVASRLGVRTDVVRGGVDVGGAELDHVWAVVEGHVIDVTMPLRSRAFADVLRAYVAGDVDDDELDTVAHGYGFVWRVVGEFPATLRYVGLPVWGERDPVR